MDDINEGRRQRLKTLIKSLNIKDKQFADRIGKRPTIISHLLTGHRNVTTDFAYEISKRYDWFNPDWLISGNGAMSKNEDIVQTDQFIEGEPRSLEDLEAIYKADPLAGLRDLVDRVKRLEREVAELKAEKKV